MNLESLVWDVHGGFPDFEDYEVTEGRAVEYTADTLERLASDEGDR